MSRFSGPAGRGASHTMRALRRAEAETRQAAEYARDEERRAAYVEPEPLTGEQLLSLLFAAARVEAEQQYRLWWGGEAW